MCVAALVAHLPNVPRDLEKRHPRNLINCIPDLKLVPKKDELLTNPNAPLRDPVLTHVVHDLIHEGEVLIKTLDDFPPVLLHLLPLLGLRIPLVHDNNNSLVVQ